MKVFIKILKIIGVIVSFGILFTDCLWMHDIVTDIEELNYPATAILPIILYTFGIVGSILFTLSIFKNNKKAIIIGAVLIMISFILFPISKAVNRTIIQATDGGAMLEAENNKSNEEKEYTFYEISDLKEMYNNDAYTDLVYAHVLGIVDDVEVLKFDDSYLYYATIRDTENNEMKIQIPSSEENLIFKNEIYVFYGNVFTDKNKISELSMMVDKVEKTD